jgi:hypothetical protein
MGQRVQTPTDSGLGSFLIVENFAYPGRGDFDSLEWHSMGFYSSEGKGEPLRACSVPWCVSCNKVSEVFRSLVAAHLIEAIQLLLGWSEALVKVFSILHLLIRVQ